MNTTKNISALSRIMLVVSSALLVISIFLPIWKIDLAAPQYPEGLQLLIFANNLGGNVDIINGLNHYIGMKTLHANEFIEFTVLPYIIGFFALLSLISAIAGKRRMLNVLFILFVFFGVVAMVDFWRWEYNYGHNLDPTAAIIVPGMAYQPPLIGYKQLLNFGAYSVPAIGGWFFISSGLLMLLSIIREKRFSFRSEKIAKSALAALFLIVLAACGNKKPETIKLNSDKCDYCKMTISDPKFGAELVTDKGRIYKFDDIACMQNYKKENPNVANSRSFVCDFLQSGNFIEAEKAFFIHGDNVASPMAGNIAGFSIKDSAIAYSNRLGGQLLLWSEIK
jgi:copper chaperone NosL